MDELRRILVATDLEGATDSIVSTAVMLSRAFDSRILLIHVVPEVLPDTWTDEDGAESVDALLGEVKLRIECALDILCVTETVLFAFESKVSHWNLFCPQCLDNYLCLVRWYNFIIETLK